MLVKLKFLSKSKSSFEKVSSQFENGNILSSLGFLFRASPQGFKTRLLGEGFHTLIMVICSPP